MKNSRLVRRAIWVLVAVVACVVGLFVTNGLWPGWDDPDSGIVDGIGPTTHVSEIRIVAFNIAKCFMYEGGVSFAEPAEVEARLDRSLEIFSRAKPDLVFLAEAVFEGGPCPVNQVEYLARGGGFHSYAFGEEYSWGLPFWRLRSGNAILSRFPLEALENIQLAGKKPFWNPENNRRTLWCELTINGKGVLAGCIRNDSFDIENNLVQTEEILAYLGNRTALLAGDFNAEPDSKPISLLRSQQRFTAQFDGSPTFPASHPTRRIDYILAPRNWRLESCETIESSVSDHLPVLAVFTIQ